MYINSFKEREDIMKVHDYFFDPENRINTDLLHGYVYELDLLSPKKQRKLEKLLEEVGDNLWSEIGNFDKQKLKETKS